MMAVASLVKWTPKEDKPKESGSTVVLVNDLVGNNCFFLIAFSLYQSIAFCYCTSQPANEISGTVYMYSNLIYTW